MVIILLQFEKKKIQLRVIHVGKNPDIGCIVYEVVNWVIENVFFYLVR